MMANKATLAARNRKAAAVRNSRWISGEESRERVQRLRAEHDAVLVLDGDVGELNPLTGIEIVRAVNKKDRKLILVNDEFNKFNKIATVVMPTAWSQSAKRWRSPLKVRKVRTGWSS